MSIIEQNLQRVHQQIYVAARDYGRDPQQITLLAVSKSKPVPAIAAAIAAGQRAFGENYVKEGVEKICWFRKQSESSDLIWHFIGPLQSNKTRSVAENFDWCHTLDRPHLVRRLNNHRPVARQPLNVLIQINISGEATKAGMAPEEMLVLAALIAECPRLRLRGIMAIPAPEYDFQRQLVVSKCVYTLYRALQYIYPGIDTLSLGMTGDMLAAIAAGSTLVRIGSTIFGARG